MRVALRAIALTIALSQIAPAQADFQWEGAPGDAQIRTLGAAKGIRILAWNMAWGHYNGGEADSNLLALAASSASPDVIVLPEYKENTFFASTREALGATYPYSDRFAYSNGTSEVAIVVFSKYGFSTSPLENLGWSPEPAYRRWWMTHFEDYAKHFDRPYQVLHFNRFDFSLVPIHLLSPWEAVYKKEKSKLAFAWEFLSGASNPLLFQVRRLRAKLERDFGKKLDRAPLLVIGDFNVPKKILGLKPRVYKELARSLQEAFVENPPTYPSQAAQSSVTGTLGTKQVKIDHAFINTHVAATAAEVLRFKGSDHYAIECVLTGRE